MTEAAQSRRSATIPAPIQEGTESAPRRSGLALGRVRSARDTSSSPRPGGLRPLKAQEPEAMEPASAPVRLGWLDPVTGAYLGIVLDVTPALLRQLEEEGFRVESETDRQAS